MGNIDDKYDETVYGGGHLDRDDIVKRRIGINTLFVAPVAVVPVLFTIVLVVFGAVFIKVWLAEKETAQREVMAVARVFDSYRQSLIDEMERYAASNAAYINIVSKPNPDWIADRFGVDMAGDFSPDYSGLIAPSDGLTFSASKTGEPAQKVIREILKSDFAGALQSIRNNYLAGLTANLDGDILFAGDLADLNGSDVFRINGIPSLVTAFAVVPDPGGIPMVYQEPYILISIFKLNDRGLAELLSILPVEQLELLDEVPEGMIGIPLKNAAGSSVAQLVWNPISRATGVIMSSIPVLFLSLGTILIMVLAALRQITQAKSELAVQEREARRAASHDSMTGFTTRAQFYKEAERLLASEDVRIYGASIIYLDLDSLKEINDIHGHMAGDWLIMSQAVRIRKFLGPDTLVGRIGGDEFVVLIENRISEGQIPDDLHRLFEALGLPVELEGRIIETSCSAGIATYPDHGRTVLEVIRSADIALQQCKTEEKRSYRLFDNKMDEDRRERRQLCGELVTALERDQFELFYQSIVVSETGERAHAEALIRWRHPERGLVSPGVFLPIAKEAGFTSEIDNWVLERAIRDASTWGGTGVSVNVSSSQFQKEGFAEHVADLLMTYGLSADQLLLEITEDLVLEEDQCTQKVFAELRDMNIGLAIDDFGTGYSSLSYLHKYPFNTMKIDRSFVARIGISEENDMLVRTLLGIAKVMGMKTIGEGVETQEQREFLVNAGCEYLQGYLVDRPAPLAETGLKRAS
ncbi:MAG: putative bifunctional diguanylate cyclase/phosphodiesterase [Labrenzia sp.]